MKRFFMKIAAMSSVLVLLCVIVVAQTENGTKSITSHRLTVEPNPVELISGESTEVLITPSEGYYHPTIYYDGETYEVGQPIDGEIFTIEAVEPYDSYRFVIRAKDVDKEQTEIIGIDVEMIPEELWSRNTVRSGGVELTIKVSPITQNKN